MATESWRAEDSKMLIKKMADDRGIKVTKLAMDAGITPSTITSGFNRGKNGPTKEVIQKLCDAYNTTLADFYTKKSDSVSHPSSDLVMIKSRPELIDFCSSCPDSVIKRLIDVINSMHDINN